MYGLLLENMKAFICEAFGEKKWNEVKDALKLKEGEIEAAAWFNLNDAIENAASEFDRLALESLQD